MSKWRYLLLWWDFLRWLTAVKGYSSLKRMIDIVISLGALVAFLPLFLLVALAVKATDGGPVLFWQDRVGRRGRVFRFPKFRSMIPNADKVRNQIAHLNDHGTSVTFKMKRDPRITWIGRIIRKFSIDELPQLWCVLAGDMSLVGPRPPLPAEVAQYTLEQRRRLEVAPGLTCIWQVSGRGDIPFHRQVAMDIEYIESRSLGCDLRLLLQTVPAVLGGHGAY